MRRLLLQASLTVAVSVTAYLLLWQLPEIQARRSSRITAFQREQLVLDSRRTNAQIIGGLALLIGLYFTWRNLRATEEGKITERFTRAVDQLGSDKIEQRVGGIFALERLAADSKRDHAAIIELLCTFLRHRERTQQEAELYKLPVGVRVSKDRNLDVLRKMQMSFGWVPNAPEDVRAVASVLRRNKRKLKAPHVVDLSNADLRRVNLEGAQLEKAELWSVYGDYIALDGANLRGAELGFGVFKMAFFDGADLRDASVYGAKFGSADFRRADLRGVKIVDAPEHEEGPEPESSMADRITVDFEYSDLRDAQVDGVIFERANLRAANLSTAVGLSYAQIEHAFGNRETKLPADVRRPPHWDTDEDEKEA